MKFYDKLVNKSNLEKTISSPVKKIRGNINNYMWVILFGLSQISGSYKENLQSRFEQKPSLESKISQVKKELPCFTPSELKYIARKTKNQKYKKFSGEIYTTLDEGKDCSRETRYHFLWIMKDGKFIREYRIISSNEDDIRMANESPIITIKAKQISDYLLFIEKINENTFDIDK